jgi:hypothetical protein
MRMMQAFVLEGFQGFGVERDAQHGRDTSRSRCMGQENRKRCPFVAYYSADHFHCRIEALSAPESPTGQETV